jgi:hypothetical protein
VFEWVAELRLRGVTQVSLHPRYGNHVDKAKELCVIHLVERFCKAVSWHVNASNVIKVDIAVLILLFSVLEVVVDVFSPLVVAVLANHIECGLVVGVQLEWLKVGANVANLGKEPLEPRGFLGGVCESNILRFSRGECDEALSVRLK